jgi:hypothetical protein
MPKVSVEVPTDEEHGQWKEQSKARGFDGKLATYIRWLVRLDIKNEHEGVHLEGK